MIPVRVKMAAHTKYTVSAVINIDAPLRLIKTFHGKNGKQQVNCGDHLKVSFGKSTESTNITRLDAGQIPSFGFN